MTDRKIYHKQYRIKNKIKIAKYKRQYKIKNREKLKLYKHKWCNTNRERLKIKQKEYDHNYYMKHKDKIYINTQQYKRINIEKTRKYNREYQKLWAKNNPFKIKLKHHNRRISIRSMTIEIVQRVYEDNIKKYGTLTCYLCEKPIQFGKEQLEHKMPLSRGGSNLYENLDIACQRCNDSKGNKTEEEYQCAKDKFKGMRTT